MKILVAAASFASSISGIQRHAFNLVRCLLLSPEISDLHLVVAPWQRHLLCGLPADSRLNTHIAEMSRSSVSRNLWYLRRLPKLAAELDTDLVHVTYPMPLRAARFRCPTVVTLHDMYPYEIPMNFGFPRFLFNRLALKQCLRNADAIACVSEATRAQLKGFTPPLLWRKSIHIPNCVEPEKRTTVKPPIPGWRGEPFLLCVAQHRKNKNIPAVIRAFEQLSCTGAIGFDTKLLVVGMRGPESVRIDRLVRASGVERAIHFLEGISEAELQWCYANCDALAAPSITEGFGLPVAEALIAGCRVVCSDIPAHREIGEGHCIFVSLGKGAGEALTSAIAKALAGSKKQPIPLPQFSAAVLMKQYLALYRQLIVSAARNTRTQTASPVRVVAS